MNNPDTYYSNAAVIELDDNSRARFITRTYAHLTGAIFSLVGIEVLLFTSGLAYTIANAMMSLPWYLFLGAFMIVGWFATRVSHTSMSKPAQYGALAGYVVAQSLLLVPLLAYAQLSYPSAISSAALVTFVGFALLTAIVFVTRKDFSFLRTVLVWGFVLALIAIGASLLFGFTLGVGFCVIMVGLAGAAVLYDTSNVLHHYPEDRYVGASLQLFSSIALMFWYVLQIFLFSRD